MTLPERTLDALLSASRPLLPLLSLASREWGRAAAERRNVVHRLEAWASRHRDPELPLVWLHGASAGELVGAVPVVGVLRAELSLQLLVTYFSPSAEPVLDRLDPDVTDVLPLDTRRETARAIRAVRPRVIVFATGDVWPNLTRSAVEREVPMALINGTVRPGSGRLSRPGRWLLGAAYRRLDRIGAASADDGRRLRRLGARPGAMTVTGDAAVDQARRRVRRARDGEGGPADRLRDRLPAEAPVLVAGSTWREDEAALLEAVRRLERGGRDLQLVLVPHDPDRDALASIRRRSRRVLGREPRLWSGTGDGPEGPGPGPGGSDALPPLVVDRVGILADLYVAADLAWVGGGLGTDGLHSVVEPAAAGIPVLFGDRSRRRESRELEEAGGARAVAPDRLAAVLERLLDDPGERRRMGRAAREYVSASAGASREGARLIRGLLGG